MSAPRTVPQKLPKVRLRTTLVVTFVVQIVAAVGLVGYLSFRNAQKAVNTLASQLRSELSARIQQELKSYFENPYRLNQLNSRAFLRGELDVTNIESVPPLLEQLKISPLLYAIYCGNSQGEFLGAVRILENNSLGLWTANPWTQQHLYLYNIDAEGRPTTLHRDSGTIYDPRKRPWYEKAKITGRPVWSDVYLAFSTGLPTVTASQPIYDSNTGDLLGVCATDVLLPDDFRKFLSSLSIGKSGIAFVSDRTGQLLSSSTDEPLTVGDGKQAKLLPATKSQNPLIRAAAQQLLDQYGSFSTLEQPLQTEFFLNDQRQFIQVLPFKDGRGLDWLIVVVIPETDFMDEINASNRLTILLCFVALAIAILAGMITSRWISQPILKLSSASKAIAEGKLDQHIEAKGITELEILASSFNTMTYQLQESFAKLEAKNADLQQAKEALSAAKEQLEAVLNAVPGSISWMSAEGIYLGVNRDLADHLSLQPEEIIGQEIGFYQNSSDYVKFLRQFLASPEQSASQILPIIQNDQRRYYLIVVQKYQQGAAIVAVGIDITERRQAEEALRIAEENYRSIYENALEGIFQYSPQYSYINVNPAMARIYGYDSPQSLMQILRDSSYPLYLEPERHTEFINLMKEQETVSNFEFQIFRADSRKIWISASAKPVFNAEGTLLYYQGFIADITERKKAEVERQQFIEELFEVNSNLEIAMQTQLELTEAATRFVPQEFLSLLGYNSIAEVKLGEGVQHEMSILFSDIRDFTSISEKMTPEDNFQFINSYLSRMEPAITQHQGFIDKYIGDAIMALFNGGADDAIKAGITMLTELTEYNSKRGRPERPQVAIGIGINTGSLMLGTVGGGNRMDSTVISDAVNLASRIEGVTKYFGVPLLISEYTLKALKNPDLYAIRLMGRVNVKGKSEMVSVFEVFDADLPEIKAGKLATKTIFEEAVSFYNLQNYQEAIEKFEACLILNSTDRVAKFYLERIRNQM
ncbi:PAS domain S-box protein [Planktothrix serta]|uniref:PAS domain S-box protein n=1 Tax=Planktothrix serta TaxID=1678310 RepID=UPI0018CC2694|nr:adenylate/guanylate cyclase domain-containing protein [Planktothrix serta]